VIEAATIIFIILSVFMMLRGLPQSMKLLVWFVVISQVFIMILLHFYVVSYEPTGILHDDTSSDTRKYYNTAVEIEESLPIFSVTPRDIGAISGGAFHPGYYYLNILSIRMSDNPMLFLRLIKLLVFFCGLIAIARYWHVRFGNYLSMIGVAYLSFGYWEIFYYNFRNLKDGTIFSLSLIVLGFLGSSLDRTYGRKIRLKKKQMLMLAVIALIIGLLFTFRVYWAAVLGAGVVLEIFFYKGVSKRQRVIFFVLLICFALSLSVDFSGAMRYGQKVLSRGFFMADTNIIFQVVRGCMSPLPWQYSNQILIPSHCLYLLVLGMGLWSFVKMRKKPLAEAFIFFSFMLLVSQITTGNPARMRLAVVPILVTWVLGGLSVYLKRKKNLNAVKNNDD